MKRLQNTANSGATLIFIIAIILFWQWATVFWKIKPWILPPPSAIIKTIFTTYPIMLPHILATLKESIIGFILAIIVSFTIALIMDWFPIVKKTLYPLVITSQTIPIISVAPLFLVWFGYDILPKILVVLLVCFFPILINLLDGLASVDRELLNLLKSMGASRFNIIRIVKLPAVLPNFFSGLKISASYSIMGAVIGEWLGAKRGLGYYMVLSQRSFYVDRVFAAILVITILSLMVFKGVCFLERLLMPWQAIKGNEW